MFDPIPQAPRYRLVADALIAKIEDGTLPPGKKLPPDRVLVDQLGVSRATLREALIALEVMGYLETRFGSGAFVAAEANQAPRKSLPKESLEAESGFSHGPFETLDARRIIESELAALAAEQITPAQLDMLWDAANEMENASRWNAEADQVFHATIAEAAGNGVLADFAARFWSDRVNDPLWSAIETAVEDTNRRPDLVAEHQRIIEALTAGDADLARLAMRRHLESFAQSLLAQWDKPLDDSSEITPHARLKSVVTKNE
ncbi:MAG: FadR/GntR family transcriptional regulator [Dinoroseobacter sp.]|nr:FadR/GntR family transcriptional regulator [Dinoroseobacter sp.]